MAIYVLTPRRRPPKPHHSQGRCRASGSRWQQRLAIRSPVQCSASSVFGKSAVLNPGLHDPAHLRHDAEQVVSSTLLHVQWDDELFARVGQLEIFD